MLCISLRISLLIKYFFGSINFWLMKFLKQSPYGVLANSNSMKRGKNFRKNRNRTTSQEFFATFFKIVIQKIFEQMIRSSRSGEIYRKGTLKNFAKFIGKDLRQSLFFNKVAK